MSGLNPTLSDVQPANRGDILFVRTRQLQLRLQGNAAVLQKLFDLSEGVANTPRPDVHVESAINP
jgi:hypothetical protein